MKFDTILFEEKDSVALITLNGPKKLNAFNQSMLFDLLKAFDHCDQSDSVKAIIITGSEEHFVQGLIYLLAKIPLKKNLIIQIRMMKILIETLEEF